MTFKVKYSINSLELPTVWITLLGYLFWTGAIYLRLGSKISPLFTVPLSTIGVYTLFTPLHEAAHSNISSNKLINDIVGNIVAFPFFFATFDLFKFLHLEHHRHTNVIGLDPDIFSRYGIISCMLMPLHYYKYFLIHAPKQNNFYRRAFCICMLWLLVYMSYLLGSLNDVVILWILPSFLAIGILSYLFDYLPHRDHTDSVNITKMTDGLKDFNGGKGNDLVSILTCNQLTYHHVHHLHSKIPFYKYPEVWEENYEEFKDKIETQTIF